MTFFAQSNLPQLILLYWSGLGAAAAISQLLTQTLQSSKHSKAATTWPSWMAATSGRSQTDGCLQRAEKLAAVSLHSDDGFPPQRKEWALIPLTFPETNSMPNCMYLTVHPCKL